EDRHVGLVATSARPMVLCSHQILRSDNTGPSAGTLVMGFLLNEDRWRRIRSRTLVDAHLDPPADLAPAGAAAWAGAPPGDPHAETRTDTVLRLHQAVTDIDGRPLLLVGVDVPRQITASARTTLTYAWGFMAAIVAAVVLVGLLVLRRTVTAPLGRMASHAESIGSRQDLSGRLAMERDDELGTLADALDRMMERLDQSQQELRRRGQRLAEMAGELSRTEEQQRRELAAALHEGIGQSLFAIAMNAGSLRKAAPDDRSRQAVDRVLQLAEQAIARTRSLTFELCPPELYEMGLSAALRSLGEQFAELCDLDVRMDLDSEDGLDQEVRHLLYRSVRELLMNVIKHSAADRVRITMHRDARNLVIEVADNGSGMAPQNAATRKTGFGLFSIQERLAALGGRMDISSTSGEGVCVMLCVPVDRPATRE
ncbi:MAG: ATP-binding protein, partial [Armatimonadota bacterium]